MRHAICILFLVTAACSANGPSEPPPEPVPFERLSAELHQALCTFQVSCGLMADVDSCLRSTCVPSGDLAELQAAIADGRVRYDAAAAAEYLAGLRHMDCTISSMKGALELAPSCARVLEGTVPAGEACPCDRSECPVCESGVCYEDRCTAVIEPTRGQRGDRCSLPEGPCSDLNPLGCDSCGDGLFCDGATCQPELAEGAACERLSYALASDACPGASVCVTSAICTDDAPCTGTCRIPPAEGETCVPRTPLFCDNRLATYCSSSSLECERMPLPGEACLDFYENERGRCIGYAECDAQDGPGVCVQRKGPGEACDFDQQCLGQLVCTTGTCELPAECSTFHGLTARFTDCATPVY